MWSKCSALIAIFIGGVMVAGNVGCAAFNAEIVHRLHEASLRDGRTVSLWEHTQTNALLRGPQHNHAELSLLVSSDEGAPLAGGVVANRAGRDFEHAPRFSFGPLEARVDQAKTKVWIVDTETARVIASLDCVTGARTGPDDPAPSWATPAGGLRLDEIRHNPSHQSMGGPSSVYCAAAPGRRRDCPEGPL